MSSTCTAVAPFASVVPMLPDLSKKRISKEEMCNIFDRVKAEMELLPPISGVLLLLSHQYY